MSRGSGCEGRNTLIVGKAYLTGGFDEVERFCDKAFYRKWGIRLFLSVARDSFGWALTFCNTI